MWMTDWKQKGGKQKLQVYLQPMLPLPPLYIKLAPYHSRPPYGVKVDVLVSFQLYDDIERVCSPTW